LLGCPLRFIFDLSGIVRVYHRFSILCAGLRYLIIPRGSAPSKQKRRQRVRCAGGAGAGENAPKKERR